MYNLEFINCYLCLKCDISVNWNYFVFSDNNIHTMRKFGQYSNFVLKLFCVIGESGQITIRKSHGSFRYIMSDYSYIL